MTPVSGDSRARIHARARDIEVIKLGEQDLLPRFRTPPQAKRNTIRRGAEYHLSYSPIGDQIMLATSATRSTDFETPDHARYALKLTRRVASRLARAA